MAWIGTGWFQLTGDREHKKNQSWCLRWLQSGLCFFRLVWKEHPERTAGNCFCLLKQDLSTEIPQSKDQLISILRERQKSACSPTPQESRAEVRPQMIVTEQPPHLVSSHLFLSHTENLLTQRAIQVHSQHLALEGWKHLNKIKCTVPFAFALEPRTPQGELHHSPSAHRSSSHHRGCF